MDKSVEATHVVYFKKTFLLLAVKLKRKVNTYNVASGVKVVIMSLFV